MIKQDVIDRVREQTDIVELIGSYLQLKRVGRNYRGLCPFHAERSPSFYVNPERQSYHCFGCGTGGTAFSFVMAHEKLEFPEAVRSLAKRLGIEVETEAGPGRNQPLYDAGEAVAGFFERQLGENPRAREYVARRGLRPETVKRFRLGFAPGGNRLRAEAGKLGLAEDVLVRAGVLAQRDAGLGDYFFNRVMFPVFSVGGRIVGFSGRVLDDREPKYLNSPDTPVFHKGELLYGLFQAKGYIRAQLPVLVEGNFDLLALADRGIDNVVATLGTALTPTQAATLRRFNPRVCLCYDGDQAGRKACRRALEVVLAAGIDPQVAVLPDGTDPDSYVRQNGAESFKGLVEQAQDFVDAVLGGRAPGGVAEQRAVLGELAGLLDRVADETARELYANKVARRFDVDKRRLLRRTAAREGGIRRRAATGIEERLVAAAVLNAGFAAAAAEMRLSDLLTDPALQEIARLTEERGGEPGFGAGKVMDLLADPETRRRVAAWTFGQAQPTLPEFRERLRAFRAARLREQVDAAHRAGDEERAAALLVEQSALRQEIVRERSHRG